MHLDLCHDPKYHKVPFSEKDKVVAGWLGVIQQYVSYARRGVNYFSRFHDMADPYLCQRNRLPVGLLVKIVDCYFAHLRALPKYKKSSPAVLGDIIAKDLGYSRSFIKFARLGRPGRRHLKGCVTPSHRAVAHPGAKVTYSLVRKAYAKRVYDPEFRQLTALQKDMAIAKERGLSVHTVKAVRLGYNWYTFLGGFNWREL